MSADSGPRVGQIWNERAFGRITIVMYDYDIVVVNASKILALVFHTDDCDY